MNLKGSKVLELNKQLHELLELVGAPKMASLKEAVLFTQDHWYQKGKERWQLDLRHEEKKEQALPLLRKLGCIDAVRATRQHYDYALLLGGFVPRMQDRVQFLLEEWARGVRFSTLVILTGKRPLDPVAEKEFIHLQTEDRVLVDLLKLPEDMARRSQVFINVPMLATGRPNTRDTIVAWLATQPTSGTCLIIGNQPFVPYFEAVFKRNLPGAFFREVIGGAADTQLPLSLFLDNLARTLYEMNS